MTPAPGEVYLADLGIGGKVRPVLVVSRMDADAPRALALCVPLTTQNRGSAYEVELPRVRFLSERSFANVQGLASFRHDELSGRLGRFELPAVEQVRVALRYILEL
ncbi:MAG TPA: type II toxin-antitoxin system PemK/MazF family toxin [Chthoniobacteraceae bacterium]|nr:type II toxin-antitoxin system PemK/MazF family toxin [Chthoniobacteraceae bacterium]